MIRWPVVVLPASVFAIALVLVILAKCPHYAELYFGGLVAGAWAMWWGIRWKEER